MNIFSFLRVDRVVDLYLSSDEETKISFSRVCTYFRDIKKSVDIYSKTHRFILDNYDIISESSSIKELTIPVMFRWNAVLISEYHCCKKHRFLNSQLVNSLWQQSRTEIFLESPDDVQIPFSSNKIKSQIQCWDSVDDFGKPLFSMMHGMCEISKAYVINFDNNTLNFADFFHSYVKAEQSFYALADNPKFADFYSTLKVRKICLKALNNKNIIDKKKQLARLTLRLQQESTNILNYINDQVDAHDDTRNLSLANAACRSINSKKIPLVVAGHSHIVSRMMQVFSKTKSVLCVALKPKIKGHETNRAEHDNNNLLQVYDAVDAETDFWSETTTLLRVASIEPENFDAFSLANPQLILALKAKIKQYTYNNDDIYLWAEIPLFIYCHELLTMELYSKDPDANANATADQHLKKRRVDGF